MKARTVAAKKAIKRSQRKGRPRSDREREANGRPRRETPEEIMSVAMSNPDRSRVASLPSTAKPIKAHHAVAGYPLGRLHAAGLISKDQLEAGNWYAIKAHKWSALQGIPVGTPRSPDVLLSVAGFDHAEPDERYVKHLSAMYTRCVQAMREQGGGVEPTCWAICVAELDEATLDDERLGELRVGLNAINRVRKT